ncbi:SDR family NAD(P)-dependent oxidoreductase [Novosphingobium panipatense]|uniref:NAD(P)-dependent dehydrogenase, short-chain alcohol dehydrogenase family n=1 Tax=Novosphingobium panipatense TaxID=428991 RepID=A0ABY1Q331_9SPHN|nr:NAD(P)-dependent dehydrogenase, short-chain alcohol dehydrogenase family [Novosphingobium panipatense]
MGAIAIVTGASRGAGRGIAVALGSHGCTVYVTGRSENEGDAEVPGTIHATAREVTEAGGQGIAVRCDSSDDDQIRALIERVIAEQGRIDILVNNAAWQGSALTAHSGQFWEKALEVADMITVGARSGFVTAWYAAPHMVRQDKGLILFTSSPGSMHYCMGPSYGAHKAAVDKMAFDMGTDFADAGANVACTSVWMGALTTERMAGMLEARPELRRQLEGTLESAGYTGHLAWAMFNDPAMVARFNGKTVIGAEVGRDYGITDIGGKYPPSVRAGTGASPPQYASYKVKM